MAIGVFDSGVGGLTIHRELVARFPDIDFVYLSDQANVPYGGRTGEEVVDLTRAGCIRLFEQGCDLVVLACNTACAIALRRLQQTWLPGYRADTDREVNILGIIVPTIEAATGMPWTQEPERLAAEQVREVDVLGVFATPGACASRVYEIEIDKRRQDVAVFSEPCPDLAARIEEGAAEDFLRPMVQDHVAALSRRIGRAPDRAILGCTHYEIVADLFRQALPPGVPLIHQPTATADALAAYLERRPMYAATGAGTRRFLTTGAPGDQGALVAAFWGEPLSFEAV